MPLQSHLSSLTFVRLLQEWMPAPGEPARQDVAERLGEWLTAFDSVKLDSALQAIHSYGATRATAARRPAGQSLDAAGLEAVCQRVKSELTEAIAHKVKAVSALASPEVLERPAEVDYGVYLQCYAALQKQMETRLNACRAHARQVLGKGSVRARQLAALDGVMAELLADREQKLMAAVPVYLERRFLHWRNAQPSADGLHGFEQDMRQLLMAELQMRLQPTLALIEAAQEEHRQLDTHQA